jgi:hypothetical protein
MDLVRSSSWSQFRCHFRWAQSESCRCRRWHHLPPRVPSTRSSSLSFTIEINGSSFDGSSPILINGTTNPTFLNETILISVGSPEGLISAATVPMHNCFTQPIQCIGTFSYTLTPTDPGCGWIAGSYTVTGTFSVPGQATSATTTFNYLPYPAGVNSSVSSTSTITCSSTTSTTTTVSCCPAVGTTTTTTQTVTVQTLPNWGYAVMLALLVVGVAVGYLVKRTATVASSIERATPPSSTPGFFGKVDHAGSGVADDEP